MSFLPLVTLILRIFMAILGLSIFLRSAYSLLGEKPKLRNWGFLLDEETGERHSLHHWELLLGRGKSCDVKLNYPTLAKKSAVLSRGDNAKWHITPLDSSETALLNGEYISGTTALETGDSISLQGLVLNFEGFSHEDSAIIESAPEKKALRKLSPTRGLIYLTIFQLLIFVHSLLSLDSAVHSALYLPFSTLIAATWGLYALYRSFGRSAFELETLALFLTSLSFAIGAISDVSALKSQCIGMLLGMVLFFALSFSMGKIHLAMALRLPVALFAIGLLAFNLLFGMSIFGAKNWISLGSFSFQPSELIKIAFVLVTATTLDKLFTQKNLIFTTIFAGICLGSLALMSDFGTALIFFVAFLVVSFMRSGSLGFLFMMATGAALGGGIVLQFKPYIADRFSAWGHVWDYAYSTGFQQTRSLSALASGGFFGKTPEELFLKNLGAANTDLVFAVLGESFGIILAFLAVAVIILFGLFFLHSAPYVRSTYYSCTACTACAILTMQCILNVFGTIDFLPLTGVTFPFLSLGGSSMLASWGLLSFLKGADARANASFSLRTYRLKKSKDEKLWKKSLQKIREDLS